MYLHLQSGEGDDNLLVTMKKLNETDAHIARVQSYAASGIEEAGDAISKQGATISQIGKTLREDYVTHEDLKSK